jgi:16S rRNA (cytosine1402-N4)-methyltransferase
MIFKEYGEEKFANKIARAIVHDRVAKPFKTTRDLASLIERVVPSRKPGIHPATKVFQALRIQVNQELEHIKAFLAGANGVLKPGGRIVCISFHSLEDRLVKNYFRDKAHEGKLEIVTPKAVAPTKDEVDQNPSSRSARLRAAEKK